MGHRKSELLSIVIRDGAQVSKAARLPEAVSLVRIEVSLRREKKTMPARNVDRQMFYSSETRMES